MTAMLINSRLSFLCLVVGSFMGLWTQDSQPTIEMVIAEAKARRHQAVQLAQAEPQTEPREQPVVPVPPAHADGHSGVHQRHGLPVAATSQTLASRPSLVVPNSVAPGVYRAVTHAGDVQIVLVEESTSRPAGSPRDLYTVDADGTRWYLIRLDGSARTAASGSDIIRR